MNLLSSFLDRLVGGRRRVHVVVERETEPVEEEEPLPQQAALHRPKKIVPRLVWEPQSPLTYSERLEADKHLCCACRDRRGRSVEGEFFFFPPQGTLLPAGLHELRARFVPLKGWKYAGVEETRIVEVLRRRPAVKWAPPLQHILYQTPLPAQFFTGLDCELTEGHFEFSHEAGALLEVGTHKVVAAYVPSEREALNFLRGYASATIAVTGTWVVVSWSLPETATGPAEVVAGRARDSFGAPLVFAEPLPRWLFCARCETEGAEGEFQYSVSPGDLLSSGFHTVTARFVPVDTRRFFGTSVEQRIFVHRAAVELLWSSPIAFHDGDPLDEQALVCSNKQDVAGEYVFSPALGAILPEGEHELSVSFSPHDGNYLPCEGKQRIKVLPKRTLRLQWFEPEEIEHPEPLSRAQLNARLVGAFSSTPGTFYYSPPLDAVLPAGTHTLSVRFVANKISFAVAEASVKLTVLQGQARLQWAAPDSLLVGEALFENVLCCRCLNAEGSFVYDPPLGTILPKGSHTLKATFTPFNTDNFRGATATLSLNIRERPRFSPRLSWTDPASEPLLYGSPLTAEMLNAQCSNALGSFEYDPPLGTVLSVGTHTLSARFFPRDEAKCFPGKVQSSVTILRRTPVLVWKPQKNEIVYGRELDTSILNAFAVLSAEDMRRLPGELLFTPPLHTVLECGDHVLRCEFRPKDSLNLRSVKGETSIFVQRVVPLIIWDAPSKPIVYGSSWAAALSAPRCADPSIEGYFELRFNLHALPSAGDHELCVHFFPKDIINFFGADATQVVTVLRGTPRIVWEPRTSLVYGDALNAREHCNAYVDIAGGTFSYDPPEGTRLPPGGNVPFTVTYTPTDLQNFSAVSLTRYLQIEKRVPVIDWPCASRITYGTTLGPEHLCARFSTEENAENMFEDLKEVDFVYTPSFGTLLNASREVSLRVDVIPSVQAQRNYASVLKTIKIEVVPYKPVISWRPKSSHIIEGDPLTADHLNAVVTNPTLCKGHFEYSIPIGTTLPPGRHAIEARFVPSHSQNILSAQTELVFEVAKRPPKLVWKIDPVTGQMKCFKEKQ